MFGLRTAGTCFTEVVSIWWFGAGHSHMGQLVVVFNVLFLSNFTCVVKFGQVGDINKFAKVRD